MTQLDEILEKLRLHKAEIFARFPLTELGVFGSYARGENTEDSDLDVLIEYDRKIGISIFDLIRIQKFLKRITKKEIDICTKKQILKRSFGKKAVEEAYFL